MGKVPDLELHASPVFEVDSMQILKLQNPTAAQVIERNEQEVHYLGDPSVNCCCNIIAGPVHDSAYASPPPPCAGFRMSDIMARS